MKLAAQILILVIMAARFFFGLWQEANEKQEPYLRFWGFIFLVVIVVITFEVALIAGAFSEIF